MLGDALRIVLLPVPVHENKFPTSLNRCKRMFKLGAFGCTNTHVLSCPMAMPIVCASILTVFGVPVHPAIFGLAFSSVRSYNENGNRISKFLQWDLQLFESNGWLFRWRSVQLLQSESLAQAFASFVIISGKKKLILKWFRFICCRSCIFDAI